MAIIAAHPRHPLQASSWRHGHLEAGKATVDAADWDGPKFQTCMNAAWVSRAYDETSLRREVVSWSVHRVLAPVESEPDRLAMLAEAARDGWTDREAVLVETKRPPTWQASSWRPGRVIPSRGRGLQGWG
jgi:hypothetical protein